MTTPPMAASVAVGCRSTALRHIPVASVPSIVATAGPGRAVYCGGSWPRLRHRHIEVPTHDTVFGTQPPVATCELVSLCQ